MACRKDEPVTVQPPRLVGVQDEGVAEKEGAKLGAAKREPEVAGVAGVDSVNGQAAGLVRGFLENVGL